MSKQTTVDAKALDPKALQFAVRASNRALHTDSSVKEVVAAAVRAYLSAAGERPTLTALSEQPAPDHAGLTLARLQAAHIERQEEWCPDQKPDLSFRGNEMAGETGEACNIIKKLERERHGWRGSRATLGQLAEELADVVHTAVLCAITAGIDLEPAVAAKFNATSEKNGLSSRIEAIAALSRVQEPVAVPVGWYLVPEVPTESQMQAGLYQSSHDATYEDVCQAYMDMVRTPLDAPALATPPAPQQGGYATDGWQSMESAPKDGRRVLLWNKQWEAPNTGQFYGVHWGISGQLGPFAYPPTHWMPLPATPAASQGGADQ